MERTSGGPRRRRWLAALLVAAAPHVWAADPQELVARVSGDVAELRGLAFEREVRARIVEADETEAYVRRRVEALDLAQRLADVERAYERLGLLPAGTDLLEAYSDLVRGQAGGFYDPQSGEFCIVRGASEDLLPLLAAHELTHALEDQHFDLDERLKRAAANDDLGFALGAVHEGSATLLMTVYAARRMLSGELDPAALTALAEAELGRLAALRDVPPVLVRQLLGPYVLGAAFLTGGDLATLAGGFPQERVDRTYREGPLSSEQILHPEKYWDAGRADLPTPVDPGGAGRPLGKRWKRSGDGVLGELVLGALVGAPTPLDAAALAAGHAADWTNDAAAGWDGDRWELWRRGDDAVLLLLSTWDTERDALEFHGALPESDRFVAAVEGRRVALVAGAPDRKAGALLARLLSAAP